MAVNSTYCLQAEEELRIKAGGDVLLQVVGDDSRAEMFGAELVVGRVYCIPKGASCAVFTYYGCTVKIEEVTSTGKGEHRFFTSNRTHMAKYAAAHASLEELRDAALKQKTLGPIALVCDSQPHLGKTTLCKILANYATRSNRQVILVDLDPYHNMLTIPGSISAVVMDSPLHPTDGAHAFAPLSFWVGCTDIDMIQEKPDRYFAAAEQLADLVGRCLGREACRAGGVIINVPSALGESGIDLRMVRKVIEIFQVTVTFCLGEGSGDVEEILKKDLEGRVNFQVVPQIGGVMQCNQRMRLAERDAKVREYFYGSPSMGGYKLSPHRKSVQFDALKVFKIVVQRLDPRHLPIGVSQVSSTVGLVRINPNMGLLKRIGAVSSTKDEGEVLNSCTAGYMSFVEVDMNSGTYSILLPSSHDLPSDIIVIADDLEWTDN